MFSLLKTSSFINGLFPWQQLPLSFYKHQENVISFISVGQDGCATLAFVNALFRQNCLFHKKRKQVQAQFGRQLLADPWSRIGNGPKGSCRTTHLQCQYVLQLQEGRTSTFNTRHQTEINIFGGGCLGFKVFFSFLLVPLMAPQTVARHQPNAPARIVEKHLM